nr:MAG: hypothetical protein DIU68_18800 [Chloroflexota bacterium]
MSRFSQPPVTEGLDTGYFLFSLDTELAWGHFDRFRPEMFSADGQRERNAISQILDVLDEYGIVATWALVGHLFGGSYPEEDIYPQEWRGKYPRFEAYYRNHHPLLHGKDVIDLLLERGKRHEFGFHGLTHQLFDEKHMPEQQARYEIEGWLRLAQRTGIVPRVVIFPRNRVGHLPVFRQFGFTCYRGIEVMPPAYRLPLLGKFLRRYSEELSIIVAPQVYVPSIDASGLVNLPASRWLFGFNRRIERVLDAVNLHLVRIQPILRGIDRAARERRVFHLWAHPYEFRTRKDIEKLRYIFRHVAEHIEAGTLRSVGMAQLAGNFLPSVTSEASVNDFLVS